MKTVEDLEKEYEEFSVDKPFITNLMEFLAYIEIGIDDLVVDQDEAKKEIRHNNKDKFMLKLIDFIQMINPEEDPDITFIDSDNQVLQSLIVLQDMQAEYFARLAESATEDNFKELLKLLEFAVEYYNKNIDYYEKQRDMLESSRKGFSMYVPIENYVEVFYDFFDIEISKFAKTEEKPVVKTK